MPAVIVHPQLAEHAQVMYFRRNSQFKLITSIDWPKGECFGGLKLRGLTAPMMGVDGFEIMLTGGKTEAETFNEAKIITEFIKNQLSPLKEVRFVLGCFMRTEEEVLTICRGLKNVPTPTLVRTDHHLKMQVTKANVKAQCAIMDKIRTVCPYPLKVSGNIDSVKTLAGCLRGGASRCAVSLQQAQSIIKGLQDKPEEFRELMEAPPQKEG